MRCRRCSLFPGIPHPGGARPHSAPLPQPSPSILSPMADALVMAAAPLARLFR